MDQKVKSMFRIHQAPKNPTPYQAGYIDGWTASAKRHSASRNLPWWKEYSEGYFDGRCDRNQIYNDNKELFDAWDNSVGVSQEDYLLTSLRLTSITLKRVY